MNPLNRSRSSERRHAPMSQARQPVPGQTAPTLLACMSLATLRELPTDRIHTWRADVICVRPDLAQHGPAVFDYFMQIMRSDLPCSSRLFICAQALRLFRPGCAHACCTCTRRFAADGGCHRSPGPVHGSRQQQRTRGRSAPGSQSWLVRGISTPRSR